MTDPSYLKEQGVARDLLLCNILLIICVVAAYAIKKFRLSLFLPDSGAAMLLGMVFGVIAKFAPQFSEMPLRFKPGAFFYGFLPPIIYIAGFTLKKRDFFKNFTSINLFAVAGTIISTMVVGLGLYGLYALGLVKELSKDAPLLESMMFGSLISAIDPVATLAIFADLNAPPLLYNVVFGESVLNDAVAIVLFRTFESFYSAPGSRSSGSAAPSPAPVEFSLPTMGIAFAWFFVVSLGSILVGVVVALLAALMLKAIDMDTSNSKFELSLVILTAYFAYLIAEAMQLSGIMALFFTGICHAHYGYHNVSSAAKSSSKHAFESIAFLAETFVFAYLGLQVIVFKHVWDIAMITATVPLCLIGRALNVFPLSALANRTRRQKITTPMQLVMWMCGLRGAIAYALAVNLPTHSRALETTTLFIVVTSTIVLGAATGPTLAFAGLRGDPNTTGVYETLTPTSETGMRSRNGVDGVDGDDDDEVDFTPVSGAHRMWKSFDQRVMQPLFSTPGGRVELSSSSGSGARNNNNNGGALADQYDAEMSDLEDAFAYDPPRQPDRAPRGRKTSAKTIANLSKPKGVPGRAKLQGR